METSPSWIRPIVQADPILFDQLQQWAHLQRLVFFAGLPGVGKSLLMNQLAHIASTAGRTVHLLQWDVARPVFEASTAGQRYPVINGVTHGVIRKAVGLWVRNALVQWDQQYAAPQHLLIGETPFIGNRFIELARIYHDAAERLLTASASLFVLPVPSPAVRRFIEAERERRYAAPLHHQEQEDAPPSVLHDTWKEIYQTVPLLGMVTPPDLPVDPTSYDPSIYQRVYTLLLRNRNHQVINIDRVLSTTTFSVYDFAIEKRSVVPTSADAALFIRQIEDQYPNQEALQRDLDHWYLV